MSDITAETIQKVLDISIPQIHDLEDALGRKARFSTKQLHEVKASAPTHPATLTVATLAGFADLVKAKLDEEDFPSDFIIHVEDFRTITLKARKADEYGRRLELVKASPVPFDGFPFGHYIDQEEFSIGVAAMFAESEDKGYVIKTASTLTNEGARTTEDDGFTQRVVVKAGLAQKAAVDVKPRVSLAPFRTFPEVQQPSSDFIFRARCEKDGIPELMLVEADGGAWKVAAIATLKAAVESFGLNVPIVA